MSLRLSLAAACALAIALSGCSGDDEPDAEQTREPTASDSVHPDASLPATVAQAITPEHLDPVCPDGQFIEAEGVLGTLAESYAEQAERIMTYDCDGMIDQVVWAEFASAELPADLLDPDARPNSGAAAFAAGPTVLVVNDRVVEKGLDVAAYFEDLGAACGCGESDVS